MSNFPNGIRTESERNPVRFRLDSMPRAQTLYQRYVTLLNATPDQRLLHSPKSCPFRFLNVREAGTEASR